MNLRRQVIYTNLSEQLASSSSLNLKFQCRKDISFLNLNMIWGYSLDRYSCCCCLKFHLLSNRQNKNVLTLNWSQKRHSADPNFRNIESISDSTKLECSYLPSAGGSYCGKTKRYLQICRHLSDLLLQNRQMKHETTVITLTKSTIPHLGIKPTISVLS